MRGRFVLEEKEPPLITWKRKLATGLAIATLSLGLCSGPIMAQDSAISTTTDEPAVFYSDTGKPLAELTVTGVDNDFTDYSEWYGPEVGERYVAVTFEVEVVGNTSVTLSRYYFTLLTTMGENLTYANGAMASEDETSVPMLRDDVTISAGDRAEFTALYAVADDVQPQALLWQPDSGVIVVVNLAGAPEVDVTTVPEEDSATPAVGVARPAEGH